MSENKHDFFVGYLDMPVRLARNYKILIPLLILLGIGFSLWVSSSQKSAGEGVWNLSAQREISGYLTVDPYPVIHFIGDNKRSVILVQQGKKSATAVAKPYANQWVSVSGFAIDRGDWSMLELLPTSSFKAIEATTVASIESVPMGDISLRGEIIDSKCFLGVMKPGSGKVHRACAAMCLRGGMPPMFVVKNATGERFGYMLTNESGESASLELLEHVAVPVALSGKLERRGDMMYIRYDSKKITRLAGEQLNEFGDSLAAAHH